MEIINELPNEQIKLPWHKINHEKHKATCRAYQRANPDKCKVYCKKWIEANREKYNEYHRVQQRIYDKKKREERKAKKLLDELNADKKLI
jgi:hypothetical protein